MLTPEELKTLREHVEMAKKLNQCPTFTTGSAELLLSAAEENAALKQQLSASEWIRKDNALRTYDGLTEQLEDVQKESAALQDKLSMAVSEGQKWKGIAENEQASGLMTAQQLAESRARVAELEEALKFYADGEHFSGLKEWDTVSGEGDNWLFPQYDEDTIPKDFDFPEAIEIGEVARQALSRAEAKEER